nr:putative ribonuclease H protein [Tanacetum cinerariifolium]
MWFGSSLGLRVKLFSSNITSRVSDMLNIANSKSECKKLLASIATIAWNIWKSRNRFIFENAQPCPTQVLFATNIMIHEADLTLSYFSTFDPSVIHDSSQESSCFAARNCEGSLLLCLGERWHASSAFATKLIALRSTCSLAMMKVAYVAFNSVANFIWDVNFPVEITSAVRSALE